MKNEIKNILVDRPTNASVTPSELKLLLTHQQDVIDCATEYKVDSHSFQLIFFRSIQLGLDKVIISLIEKFPKLLEQTDYERSTPIIVAAAVKNIKLVNKLIELGANKDAVNIYKQNALHYLCSIQLQNEKDAKQLTLVIKKMMTCQNVNQQDDDGSTAIFAAVLTQKSEIVKEHLKYNTNFNVKNNDGGKLYEAAINIMRYKSTKINGHEVVNIEDPSLLITRIIVANTSQENIPHNFIDNTYIADYHAPETIILGYASDT